MASEVSRVQEPEPRRWPIGSKQPTDADLRVQSTQNGVIFKSLANGRRWHAEPDSGGDDRIYSWYAINGKHSAEGGMEMVEVVTEPDRRPCPTGDYATAYASLHEVVRAFLAGERNAKYLRRMHAEIDAELTGGRRG